MPRDQVGRDIHPQALAPDHTGWCCPVSDRDQCRPGGGRGLLFDLLLGRSGGHQDGRRPRWHRNHL